MKNIDCIKIDIEGSELKLLDDLLTLPISSIPIELINYNSIKENMAFINALLNKYNFVNFVNHKLESIDDMTMMVSKVLKKNQQSTCF